MNFLFVKVLDILTTPLCPTAPHRHKATWPYGHMTKYPLTKTEYFKIRNWCHVLIWCDHSLAPNKRTDTKINTITIIPSYYQQDATFSIYLFLEILYKWTPLWSSGQSFWLQIQKSRVRFPALPDFLSISGSGTGSTQPREVNWGATWIKSSGSGLENRD